MEENKKEVRNLQNQIQVKTDEEKRTVEGYALLFNTPSDGLSFTEIIERGALDGVIAKSDVFALLNHDFSKGVLARSNKGSGSLSLSVDDKGLLYRFEAPKSSVGTETVEHLDRGEINESSFSFDVESDTWTKDDKGHYTRTIHKIGNLYDVSPVYSAAYSKTSVYTRGKEDLDKSEDEIASHELDSYYEKINKSINI
jgi:phage prohead protease, HK97 family